MARVTKWMISGNNVHEHGVHTSSSVVGGRQNHLLCSFSQGHILSAEEANVLISAIKPVRFLFRKEKEKRLQASRMQVYQI